MTTRLIKRLPANNGYAVELPGAAFTAHDDGDSTCLGDFEEGLGAEFGTGLADDNGLIARFSNDDFAAFVQRVIDPTRWPNLTPDERAFLSMAANSHSSQEAPPKNLQAPETQIHVCKVVDDADFQVLKGIEAFVSKSEAEDYGATLSAKLNKNDDLKGHTYFVQSIKFNLSTTEALGNAL